MEEKNWPFVEEPIEDAGSEHGALFIRATKGITEELSELWADEVEGLIALQGSGDWKASFIGALLSDFREGHRASPADVLHMMHDAVRDLQDQIRSARAINENYRAFLNPEAEIPETMTRIGTDKPAVSLKRSGKGKRP
jgi:hypothetical protein